MTSAKRWYRSRRNHVKFIAIVSLLTSVLYIVVLHLDLRPVLRDLNITRREVDKIIQDALKEDKGTGCNMPKLDPFSSEVTQYDKILPKITCGSKDWAKCYLSECKVVKEILETTKNIECTYRDIIYENDRKYVIGPPTTVRGEDAYVLARSDHVKIKCTGKHLKSFFSSKWTGHSLGFRTSVERKAVPPGREDSINVLIFGYDSTSRSMFVRKMPKSYEFLTKELKATVLNRYNVVGDGTPAALFPILSGKTELEFPDVRKSMTKTGNLDSMEFIFHKLRDLGYRTAYFEDTPSLGTFQYRFNGFSSQPADHYLRDFYLEQYQSGDRPFCVGDTPRYKVMMNITDQFSQLDGKRFSLTFIADITHDDYNLIATADDDMLHFLRTFRDQGGLEDTLLIVMGDHGPRFDKSRRTFRGKLEERLPLMALVVPGALRRRRPRAHAALERNAHALATPHDLHATLLDALDLTQHWNAYKVPGADLTRALTLLQPIPSNRSCSEAGIEPHWCACAKWRNVSKDDKLYKRSAEAFVDFINSLTEPMRDVCALRTLRSISWMMRQQVNKRMMQFVEAGDADGYVGRFKDVVQPYKETYQIKIEVGPGRGIYEVTLTYLKKEDRFQFDTRDVSRINPTICIENFKVCRFPYDVYLHQSYSNEPSCISATHPHLNMYCFCN